MIEAGKGAISNSLFAEDFVCFFQLQHIYTKTYNTTFYTDLVELLTLR